jgi:CubicO group peptidase (beta-lactamase class C family)
VSRKQIFIGLFILLCLFLSLGLLLGCEEAKENNELSVFMSAYVEHCSYPYSGTILVAKGDEILLNEGYGMANYEKDVPNTSDTVFPIGSITKSFTAVAVMQLYEDGLLNLEDPISKYTGFEIDDETLTVHQLLTHTSGLPREGKYVGKGYVTLDEHIEYIRELKLLFKPGEDQSYSNAGYILLAYMIEEITENTYTDYMTENILEPLNMTQTYFSMDAEYKSGEAIGYRLLKDNPMKLSIYNFSNIIGSGNIYSSTNDLYKYDQSFYNETLIKRESSNKIMSPQWGNEKTGYGYGWEISSRYDHKKISHGGVIGGGGYTSLMIRYPEKEYVLIFLTNNSEPIALNAVSETLEAIIFDKDYVMPVALGDYEVPLKQLKSYTGNYRFPEGFTVSITLKDEQLYSNADDGNQYELRPYDEHTFFFEGHELIKLEFEVDGETNKNILKFYNRTSYYEGIKEK